jgi:hypothetical protein
MLFPSPTNTILRPSSLPQCSTIVSASASTWHGWLKSVSPFTTGTVDAAERASISLCANRRAMMTSL